MAVAAGWLGARLTLDRPARVASSAPPAVVKTDTGTIGKSFDFTAKVTWPTERSITNAATGTVTARPPDGSVRKVGDTLYEVDLVPVRAFQGVTPMFRDLARGTRGSDVAQLRASLTALGYSSGTGESFDWALDDAVRRWQRATDQPVSGVVARGRILFLPTLPVRVSLSAEMSVGARVSDGVGQVRTLAKAPLFAISVTEEQASSIPADKPVIVSAAGQQPWRAKIAESVTTDEGRRLILSAPDGGSVCGAECDALGPGRESVVQTRIVLVPETKGTRVPRASLRTRADGSQEVVLSTGEPQRVKVLAESGGYAVVEGIEPGRDILLLTETSG